MRRPGQEKCRKVAVRNRVPRKVPKKALRAPRLCRGSIGDGTPEHFSRHFPRHPVSDRHFLGTFPGRGFGTSLEGRQDRKICLCFLNFMRFSLSPSWVTLWTHKDQAGNNFRLNGIGPGWSNQEIRPLSCQLFFSSRFPDERANSPLS